jgi:aminoglycoside phosphotransferase (APT) family kinase protein
MEVRKGRRNILEFVDAKIIRKISVIKEETRPSRLKVEAWALSQARSHGINVPRVIDYYLDEKGREVLVLERIFGKSLSLNPPKENTSYIFNIGKQLASLKNIGVNYGWIDSFLGVGNSESWRAFILTYTKKYGERLVKEKVLKNDQFQKLLKLVELIKTNIAAPYLIHRDIRLPNLIKDDNGKVWIVDWENAILGDPLYDLALFGVRYGHGILWRSLKSGYGFNLLLKTYDLYEIVALIGIIDFYLKNQIGCRGMIRRLGRMVDLV